jgi:hypothetical protein
MKLLFPKQNYKVLSPSSKAHISVRNLYISRIGLPILMQENMWTNPGNTKIARRHMNVEIGTEIAQFPEKEYLIGIFRCSAYEFATKISKFPRFFVTSAALGSVCIRMFWELIEGGDTGRCQVPTHHIPSTPPIHVHHLTLILKSLPPHHSENPSPPHIITPVRNAFLLNLTYFYP